MKNQTQEIQIQASGKLFGEMDAYTLITKVEVLKASVDTLKVFSSQELELDSCYWMEVVLAGGKTTQILISANSNNQQGEYGFSIVFDTPEWTSTIAGMQASLV